MNSSPQGDRPPFASNSRISTRNVTPPRDDDPKQVSPQPGKLAYTSKELSIALGICRRTLRRLELRGLLRPSKVLRKKLYFIADVQKFLEEAR